MAKTISRASIREGLLKGPRATTHIKVGGVTVKVNGYFPEGSTAALFDLVESVGGAAVFNSVECVLKSGRKFRYQFDEYPFGPDTTPEQAEALARRIASAKYRYCPWDQAHPRNDSEGEIIGAIKAFILDWVARWRRVRQQDADGARA